MRKMISCLLLLLVLSISCSREDDSNKILEPELNVKKIEKRKINISGHETTVEVVINCKIEDISGALTSVCTERGVE